jgi:hypothetical protein
MVLARTGGSLLRCRCGATFHQNGVSDFLRRFGWAGAHAVTAWTVSAPFMMLLVYLLVRVPLARMATVIRPVHAA